MNFKHYLYESLPEVYREKDIDTGFTLKRYLEALGEGLDIVNQDTTLLLQLLDVERMDKKYLSHFAKMFGVEYGEDVPEEFQRKFLANLIDIYKRKGTREVIEFIAREITGMRAEVREGHHFKFRTWGTNPHKEMFGGFSTPKTFSDEQDYTYYLGGSDRVGRYTTYVTLYTEQDVNDVDIREELIRRFTKGLIPSYTTLVFRLRGTSVEEEVIYPILEEEYKDIESFGDTKKSNIQYQDSTHIVTKYTHTVPKLTIMEADTKESPLATDVETVNKSISYDHTDNITKYVIGVTLDTPTLTLEKGSTHTLIATIEPQDATNTKVTWKSSHPSIVEVNQEGTINAHQVGKATITVTTEDGSKTATCEVTVEEVTSVPPTPTGTIVLNKTSYTINQGEMLVLSGQINVDVYYASYEIRKDGEYLVSAYRSESDIICYTNGLEEGSLSNLTVVAKVLQDDRYVDLAQSQVFTLTVNGEGEEGDDTDSLPPVEVPVDPPTEGGSISISSTSFTINEGEELRVSATVDISDNYVVYEVRKDGQYLVSAYRSGSEIICHTYSLGEGQYSNLTIVAKTMSEGSYVDLAQSQTFTLTVNGSDEDSGAGGGSGSGGSDEEGSTPPVSQDEFARRVLSLMPYPRVLGSTKPHECIPNGAPYQWNRNARWENIDKPSGWKAFGGWAQVYRVEGTPFSQNTGVELKDYQVYGWKNGQWHLVSKVPTPSGYFYAEDFQDDKFGVFPSKMLYYETSVAIRLTEDMTVQTSTGTKNVCYHPFTTHLDYDPDFEYVFTCVSMRKIKWDEHGVDDRDNAKYCASCGGDWWRDKGLSWAPDWSNNKGIAQPVITEVTNEWKVFTMTTVPEDWSHGFPMDN